jgi:hypothetical protein
MSSDTPKMFFEGLDGDDRFENNTEIASRQFGGHGRDTLIGGGGFDHIEGGADADLIRGRGSDDHLYGGPHNDDISGGDGNDTMDGQEHDDTLRGGAGADDMRGEEGKDELYEGLGADTLAGGDNDDYIEGGDGPDVMYGGDDDDEMFGQAGPDTLFGGAGEDDLSGGPGDDVVYDFNAGGYLLTEHWGGMSSDADKSIFDSDDDLMCWAAAASNVLEWTGWGLVDHWDGLTWRSIDTVDEMFAHFQAQWLDVGGFPSVAWGWWFDLDNVDDLDLDLSRPGGEASILMWISSGTLTSTVGSSATAGGKKRRRWPGLTNICMRATE